jgi:mono/diheme cytochrome c family protein
MTIPRITSALLALLGSAATLAACQTADSSPPNIQPATPAQAAQRAPAFVEAACGGCHAVEPPFLSPNPESPSFAAIANREGLTEDTLGAWLLDAHNYPEQMDFTLTREQAEQIADYMVTLRRADYRPDQ